MTSLLTFTLATSAWDRVDLAQGRAGFTLTPFYVTAPLLLLALWSRRRRSIAHVERRAVNLLVLLLAYAVCALISAVATPAGSLSDRRVVLLVFLMFVTWAMITGCGRLPDFGHGIRRGAVVGLALTAAMDVAQYISWLTVGPDVPAITGPLDYTAPTLGLEAPRLSGVSFDPNRGAFFICLCVYLLALDPGTGLRPGSRGRPWSLAAGGLLTLLTFSRTGLLLYVLLLAGAWWQSARSGRSPIRIGGLVAIAASAAALYWLYVRTSGEVDLTSLLQERADFEAGASGGIHLDLIRRGLDVFGSSPWNFLFGIGVGNSPVVLQDFFPGNPYANFHSLYITVLVEGGALATTLLLIIMFRPLGLGRPFLVVLGGVFGVFYQANLDPTSWLVIAIAWCAPLAFSSAGAARLRPVASGVDSSMTDSTRPSARAAPPLIRDVSLRHARRR